MKPVLCFGDSNTYGYIPGGKGRYEWGVRWTSIADSIISLDGYRVIEEGLCGRTTIFEDEWREGLKGTDALPKLLDKHNPCAVVIMLGTNDCKRFFHADSNTICQGMEQLVRQVRDYDPDLPVVLVSPINIADGISGEDYDPEFDESAAALSRTLPEGYRRLSDRYHTGFFAASVYAYPSEVDKEHMDADGHKRLGIGIGRYLRNYLASCPAC